MTARLYTVFNMLCAPLLLSPSQRKLSFQWKLIWKSIIFLCLQIDRQSVPPPRQREPPPKIAFNQCHYEALIILIINSNCILLGHLFKSGQEPKTNNIKYNVSTSAARTRSLTAAHQRCIGGDWLLIKICIQRYFHSEIHSDTHTHTTCC